MNLLKSNYIGVSLFAASIISFKYITRNYVDDAKDRTELTICNDISDRPPNRNESDISLGFNRSQSLAEIANSLGPLCTTGRIFSFLGPPIFLVTGILVLGIKKISLWRMH